jgi:hypothetical protein
MHLLRGILNLEEETVHVLQCGMPVNAGTDGLQGNGMVVGCGHCISVERQSSVALLNVRCGWAPVKFFWVVEFLASLMCVRG